MKTEFLLPVMLLFASDSHALDWLLEPDFDFKERYEDNVTMQIDDPVIISSMISTISPGVLLGYIADDNELKTRFKWNELIYHDASDLDFSEKKLDVSHQYQTDWFKTNLDASYYEESSINTQLADPTNNIAGQTLIPRTTRSISPGATINLTARNSLQLAYSYLDVTFDRPQSLQNLSYSDYTNQQYSASAIHAYSERLSFNLTGAYSEFESTGDQNGFVQVGSIRLPTVSNQLLEIPIIVPSKTTFTQKSQTVNFQAGLQYAFDEQTQLAISAGARNTDTEATQTLTRTDTQKELSNSPSTSNTTGHIFSASLIRSGEWGNFSLNAGQQLNPASSGSQQQTTSFSGQARYNLSERWSTGISASYLISESTSTFDNSTTSYNRVYTTVSPNLRWQWTPEMNFQLSYTYRQQEYTDRNQTAVGNTVQLQFSYQPQINRQVK